MRSCVSQLNLDPNEVDKFARLAHRWWDPEGELKTLHHINPCRLSFIDQRCGLNGKRVLDMGCGGGLLSEAMASKGAAVTGVDAAEQSVRIAKLHQLESQSEVEYVCSTAEEFAEQHSGLAFDVVTCMEMLEHVPQPQSAVESLLSMLKPGGDIFFSTINRHFGSWLQAIVAAEYVLRIVPRGTHEYARLIRPSELTTVLRRAGAEVLEIKGMRYNPLTAVASLHAHPNVNYLLWARKS